MFSCQLCNKEYSNLRGIAIHLQFCVQNIEKLNVEKYYLKFINSEIGKCKVCSKPTKFLGLALGYSSFCDNKSVCVGIARKQGIRADNKRTTNYNERNPVNCHMCNTQLNSINSLRNHIPFCKSNSDKITSEQYYNKYIKQNDNEGICKGCSSATKFAGLEKGYLDFCNSKCMAKNPEEHRPEYLKKKSEKFVRLVEEKGFKILDNTQPKGQEICVFQCNKCNYKFKNYIFNLCKVKEPCRKCAPRIASHSENYLAEYIHKLVPSYTLVRGDNKILTSRELDIILEEPKISIEYNGLHWHDTPYFRENDIWKTKMSIKQGYKHINIWEDDFSKFYKYDFDLIDNLIVKCITSDFPTYLNNISYFTTFDITKEEIDSVEEFPPDRIDDFTQKINRPIRGLYKN